MLMSTHTHTQDLVIAFRTHTSQHAHSVSDNYALQSCLHWRGITAHALQNANLTLQVQGHDDMLLSLSDFIRAIKVSIVVRN